MSVFNTKQATGLRVASKFTRKAC